MEDTPTPPPAPVFTDVREFIAKCLRGMAQQWLLEADFIEAAE
jgi:hypothetical protein